MKFNLTNIPPILRNKYTLTILLFLVWLFFFDQNNLVDRYRMAREIRQLEENKQYYLEQIEKDSTRLHELTTNRDNLEKFAREQYLMKKENEDVFVIVEDKRK
ncbi:MAG: septum formation initiator family protein [Bacteroidales bacterium]|nr:septum formation initiator family protein [Bacteroidales bacterium]MBN2698191.1 septum formation initiator family protein [Bacteroidales bacterium]